MPDSILAIACGALVREITDLKDSYGWDHLHLKYIDAKLHMPGAHFHAGYGEFEGGLRGKVQRQAVG